MYLASDPEGNTAQCEIYVQARGKVDLLDESS